MAIRNIEDLAAISTFTGSRFEKMKKRRGHIVAMDMIKKAVGSRVEACRPREKFRQQSRAAWTVDACEARHDSSVLKNKIFRLAQDPRGRSLRLRSAFLRDPFPVRLRIHARAAGEEMERIWKTLPQMTRARAIDPLIPFHPAAARTGALHDGVEIPSRTLHGGAVRQIDRANLECLWTQRGRGIGR